MTNKVHNYKHIQLKQSQGYVQVYKDDVLSKKCVPSWSAAMTSGSLNADINSGSCQNQMLSVLSNWTKKIKGKMTIQS